MRLGDTMSKTTYESVQMKANDFAIVLHFNNGHIAMNFDKVQNYYEDQNYFVPPHWHWHQALEFTFIKEGELRLRVNGVNEHYTSGDLMLVNSGQLHELQSLESDNFDVQCLIISHEMMKQLLPNYNSLYFKIDKNKESYHVLVSLFEKIFTQQQESYNYLLVNSVVLEMLYLLASDHSTESDTDFVKNQHFIINVIDYIHMHYDEDLSLERLSLEFSMSREHFARLFKGSIGSTFLEYLTDYRIYQAFPEIVETNNTIESISRKHGFSSSKSLITQFKSRYHQTLAQFRKNYKISIFDHNDNTIEPQ